MSGYAIPTFQPKIVGSIPSIGGLSESYNRMLANASTVSTTSGQISAVLMWLPAGTIASATAWGNTGGALTHSWTGIWSSAGSLLGTSADDVSAWISNASRTFTFTNLTIPAAGYYYMGIVVAATSPSLWGNTGGVNIGPSFAIPKVAGKDVTHTGLTTPDTAPATLTLGAGAGALIYFWVQ